MAGKGKKDALDRTLALLQKKFGATSAVRLGDGRAQAAAQVREVIPTGIEALDFYGIGIGGLPVGRVSEVFGPEACGKTSLGYACMASCQKVGGTAMVVDAEYSFDEDRARTFGVDVDRLIVMQPEHMEMGLEQLKLVLGAHDPKSGPLLLVFDTIAACIPKAFVGQEAGNRAPGEQARLMSAELPKLVPLLTRQRAHLLLLNQIRAKLGIMFGDNTTTPGGNAVKFYASWRAQYFGGKAVKDAGGEHTGKVVTIISVKTRFTAPWRKVRARLDYATGFNNEWTTLEHAKAVGAVPTRGVKGALRGAKAHAAALRHLGWAPGAGTVPAPASEPQEGGKGGSDGAAEGLDEEE